MINIRLAVTSCILNSIDRILPFLQNRTICKIRRKSERIHPPEKQHMNSFHLSCLVKGNQDSIFRVVRAHTPSVGDVRCVKGSAGLNPIIQHFFHRCTSESYQQHFFPETPPLAFLHPSVPLLTLQPDPTQVGRCCDSTSCG